MDVQGSPHKVLFVCVENANRSQMAEAFARIHGGVRVQAFSAGSRPGASVGRMAVAAMADIGYDLGTHQPKSVSQVPDVEYDCVVTMGCGDQCPFVRARQRVDWKIPDPSTMGMGEFFKVRDSIGMKVRQLLESL